MYPVLYKVTGLPAGLGSLIAILRQNEYNVRVFDTSCYADKNISVDDLRSQVGISKTIADTSITIKNITDMYEDLEKILIDFMPHILGVTLLEPTYHKGLSLIRFTKKKNPIFL